MASQKTVAESKLFGRKTKHLVNGYNRNAQLILLSSSYSNYYRIPAIINHLCLLFYYQKPEIKIGQKIEIGPRQFGVVKFVGKTEFSKEKMVGVELVKWSVNTIANSGKVKDIEYFPTNPGRGYFVRMSSISNWETPKSLNKETKRLDEEEDVGHIDSEQTDKELQVSKGDRVLTVRGYTGVVKFIGRVHFDEFDMIGIELDQWSPNACNGIVHGHEYFICPDGRGYFVLKKEIDKNFGSTEKVKKTLKILQCNKK